MEGRTGDRTCKIKGVASKQIANEVLLQARGPKPQQKQDATFERCVQEVCPRSQLCSLV